MIDIDKWLDREYQVTKYNCMSFAVDVYNDVTGLDISKITKALYDGEIAEYLKLIRHETKLDKPLDPCVVLIHEKASFRTHVGIYVQGKLLHLSETGARHEPLENFEEYRKSYYRLREQE